MLPLGLVGWAAAADASGNVRLPVPGSPTLGWSLAAAGAVLWAAGTIAIVRFGGGLPMNAYPPTRYVDRGAYALLRHPIYVGSILAVFGTAMAVRSPAGFWLVAPALLLGCVSLLLGFESPDLARRFGSPARRPWISLPPDDGTDPSPLSRLGSALAVFVPWAAMYGILAALPVNRYDASFEFERHWPVVEWTELFYASTYLFVAAAPFVARRSKDIREFAVGGLVATGIVGFCFLLLPVEAAPRPFHPSSLFGEILLRERALDVPANAFPSFHVVWALLAARAWGSRWPGVRWAPYAWAVAIAASCLATGMHSLADVAGGFVAFAIVRSSGRIWTGLARLCERAANSWREWRFGRFRVLNHSAAAGLAGFLTVSIAGSLIPPPIFPLLAVAVGGIVGAALVAQWIEGSPSLSRPYGYFGAVAGTVAGCFLAARITRLPALLLIAALSVAAPWTVITGRIRCLIQGCCHGSPARSGASYGIVYTHPMSRVVRLAGLGGTPVHPTPLYSMVCNLVIGLVLGRLWWAHAPSAIVAGAYFLLSGLGRFAEEEYRGEPQTPVWAGLRLYQWLAIAQAATGAILTALPSPAAGGLFARPSVFVAAAGFGLFCAVAYGVDAPDSRARFSRLA